MRLHCNKCGESVSTEVPDNTILRGWIECPECIEKQPSLDEWEVERECETCKPEFINPITTPLGVCPDCWDSYKRKNTGEITRPLTWEDVPHLLNNTINITIEGKDMGTFICLEFPDGGRVRRKE